MLKDSEYPIHSENCRAVLGNKGLENLYYLNLLYRKVIKSELLTVAYKALHGLALSIFQAFNVLYLALSAPTKWALVPQYYPHLHELASPSLLCPDCRLVVDQ